MDASGSWARFHSKWTTLSSPSPPSSLCRVIQTVPWPHASMVKKMSPRNCGNQEESDTFQIIQRQISRISWNLKSGTYSLSRLSTRKQEEKIYKRIMSCEDNPPPSPILQLLTNSGRNSSVYPLSSFWSLQGKQDLQKELLEHLPPSQSMGFLFFAFFPWKPQEITARRAWHKLTYADFTLFLETWFEWLDSSRILDKFRFNLNHLDPAQLTYQLLLRQITH